MAALTLGSCLSSNEVETTPECGITSFSVGDIVSGVKVYKHDGSDTIINRTIKGSDVRFNIDQINGIISSVDSLPNWADLSRVVPSFTTYGTVFAKLDSLYYPLKTGADSISFEKPVKMIAAATDGVSIKEYTVYINRSKNDIDTLVWNSKSTNCTASADCRTVVMNDRVYAFYENAEGKVQVTNSAVSSELTSWTEPVSVQAPITCSSVTAFAGELYALGTDGCIYKAEKQNRPEEWLKVSEKTFERLLAADNYYLYALDGEEIVGSSDMQNWISSGKADINMLPTECIQSFSYKSKTNANIQICMMTGITEKNAKNGVSWYKVTSKDEDINQNWMYVQVTNDNKYGLPRFKNMSTTMYGGCLYAIGISSLAEGDKYQSLYCSKDNGITWKTVEEKYPLPADLDAKNGAASIISAGGKFYIIQKGGKIWCGTIS